MNLKSTLIATSIALAANAVLESGASAIVLKWTLVGAAFDDGGVATGSFNYNTVTEAYTASFPSPPCGR